MLLPLLALPDLTGGVAGLVGRVPAGDVRILSGGCAGIRSWAQAARRSCFCRTCGSARSRGQWTIHQRAHGDARQPPRDPAEYLIIIVDSRGRAEKLPDDGL